MERTDEASNLNGQNDGTNIFDEIQQNFLEVLNNNKDSENNGISNFDCLGSDLFLPPSLLDDAEPQLYAVEQGELQPISSPFMVPGIYKKIDTNVDKKSRKADASNVYLTESEPHGRIVRNTDFHKLYVFKDKSSDGTQSDVQPRKVLLIEDTIQPNKPTYTASTTASKAESIVPRKWDALSKLAYNLLKLSNCDHTVTINRKRNEIVRTEKSTNQKTVYRFIDDDELGVQPPDAQKIGETHKTVKKLGRPKKERENTPNAIVGIEKAINRDKIVNKRKYEESMNRLIDKEPPEKVPLVCSRFGRVIKPVKSESVIKTLTAAESTQNLIADLQDKDYRCNLKAGDTQTDAEKLPEPLATSSPTKRHVPPESICPTCNKIFLGRRLKRHFVQHPDHMKPPTPPPAIHLPTNSASSEEMSLFRFLVSKLQKPNMSEDQRADLFLHELNDLVEQLQLRSSRFIRNTSGLHFVNARTARVLCIPEGQYALDMSAIDAPPEPETSYDLHPLTVPSTNTRSLDYTALSLDDTLTDEAAQKLNLSAGGKLLPPSEESLLRAVDDLVPPASISKLVPTNLLNRPIASSSTSSNAVESLVPHYDHASDNAVEAVTMKESNGTRRAPPILDLAVDFFQFKTN